ncbi:MAG TPA: transcriptional repressor LexA [Candidatus Dormibacteraeota bacterium]|nr:transcriptional repressor LexA [Candidatus Dormibacteraeota bacterium]
MKELTKRQEQILRFIQGRQDSQGIMPTFREISAHFRFSSPNAALAHVEAIIAKGFLKRLPGRARSLQLAGQKSRARVVSIPIYGTIPAGNPVPAEQGEEGCVLIDVSTLGIKPTTRTFGLKVKGESMLGKCIINGDIAIIEHGVQPRHGDVVAALIDGEVTLKTFIMQRGKPYLRAENPKFPNLIPREELQIQGVMVALIRRRK